MVDDIDLCLLDVKSGDEETYHKVTGGILQPTIDFGQRLAKAGKKIWVRFVLVPGLTSSEENVENVAKICETFGDALEHAEHPIPVGGPERPVRGNETTCGRAVPVARLHRVLNARPLNGFPIFAGYAERLILVHAAD